MKKNKPLIPQIRFKGYDDEWQSETLNEFCSFSRGQGYSKRDLTDEGHPIFLYGRLYTKYQTFVRDVDTFTTLQPDSVLSTGKEIVMPSSGEEAEDISVASAVLSKDIILGGGLNIILPNQQKVFNPFLALNITYGKPHFELAKRAQGKSVVHLYNQDIANVSSYLTSIAEQQSIASYFETLDTQIKEAEREVDRLEKMKIASLQKMFPRPKATTPEIRFASFSEPWKSTKIENILGYIQPQPYIVKSSKYIEKGIPVLTAGKSFILGYTNEDFGVFNDTPIILFDDFTTDKRLIDFPFKVKSSAAKILYLKDSRSDIAFVYYYMSTLNFDASSHRRYWISDYSQILIGLPSLDEQRAIGEYFRNLDELIAAKRKSIVKLRNIKKACLSKMFVNDTEL